MQWTSYERVKAALEHREPDRVPFDLGGSVLTGMNKVAYSNLRDYLGLPKKEIEIYDPMQQLARIDQDLIDRLEVDVRCVDPEPPETSPLTTDVVNEGDYYAFNDEWGITWKMPVDGGFYFDMRKHPLAGDITVADVEKFPWPNPIDPARFRTMKQRADHYVHDEERAYILGRNAAGILEVALWMRGFEDFFCDLGLNPVLAEAILEKVTEIKLKYWECALETVGPNVLVISEADDIATQRSLLISPEMYEHFVAPRHRRLFEMIHKKAQSRVYVFYHTCGAVRSMIPQLIDEGVEVLNPVQVSAEGMDTKMLKSEFGKYVTFWGGGVDTQRVLPFGTPEEVKAEVKRRVDDLAPGGGFVFNTVHNVQGDVPPQNYMAMWEALREYGTYH